MPIFYRQQGHIERLAAKNGAGATSNYLSDQKVALYGGRGNVDDFIKFVGTETRKSDAKVRFYSANGASAGNRADQLESQFGINGTFP